MVLSMEQDIVFVSQNVSSFLGISQVDLLGQNLMDISHPCDHSEIRELFTAKLMTERKSFFFRMKCVSSKGRGINTKSSSFKVLHTVGRFIKMGESSNEDFTFIALATPIPHPVDIEIPLGTFTFLSKHSLDMKYTYADDRMEEFMGYKREDLIGRSLFEFHHAQDYKNIERAFKGLFTKGQFDTGQYRFLAQGGGYVWVSTQATVIYNEKNGKPQSVVCVNYVISGKCGGNDIYSSSQLEYKEAAVQVKPPQSSSLRCFCKIEPVPVKPDAATAEPASVTAKPEQIINNIAKPKQSTKCVFTPATAEMNSGFLTFQDDEIGSTSSIDPEDLTHLAPEVEPFQMSLIGKEGAEDPLINGGSVSLFSYGDEFSDECLSPKLQSPGSGMDDSLSDRSLAMVVGDAEMRSLLGLDSSDEDMSLCGGQLTVEDNIPSLSPINIPWEAFSCDNSSSGGVFPSSDVKSEKGISNFEKLSHGDGLPKSSGQIRQSMKYDVVKRKRTSSIEQEIVKKRKQNVQDPGGGENSVLMNLLIAGHDLSAGYVCHVSPRKAH